MAKTAPFETIGENFISGDILIRKKDNYVSTNSIELCIKKKWKHHIQNKGTVEFIEELAKQEGLSSGLNVHLDKYTHSEKRCPLSSHTKRDQKIS
jgi:hypothetical protein